MSGSGSVFKRCGCRLPGTSRKVGGRCPRLRSRGHGSWYFSAELEHVPGRRCRVRRGGFASRDAARAALRRAQGVQTDAAGPVVWTVGEWLQHWLDTRTRLRPRTRVGYGEHIERYLKPSLGAVLLEELTPAQVQEAFDAISCRTTPVGDRLSPATVRRIRATLRAALNTAVRERLLPSNPARGLRLESGVGTRPVVWTDQAVAEWTHSRMRPAVAVWTVEQTRAFLDFVSDHRLYALFHLLVMTGLRRGEVVELKVVQAMLGHASIVLTADTYASVLPEVAQEAAERTAWLVLRDAGRAGRHTKRRRGRRALVLVPPGSHPGPTGRTTPSGSGQTRL
ncbi:integrase family protein [Nocardiopsis dassonvillei subsp. dassonvillei DSM 43111]|uniref:Integrase family protein n=1 Tax=Nocardiopsis dassonvillei (strain ATCC 23218 / DSM 43111 / CIP 107115 / JCM 7437 / KCTC 9190 / NBRC 14626 / NCTC 10488 / NRRL B-5397 / IMRU 509) TaxID=446468 RepID=D7B3U1_NOCDD|nr:integrase family protein [Nocardiopsis dassonvillei subsp. dassonvillei DSM 43111]